MRKKTPQQANGTAGLWVSVMILVVIGLVTGYWCRFGYEILLNPTPGDEIVLIGLSIAMSFLALLAFYAIVKIKGYIASHINRIAALERRVASVQAEKSAEIAEMGRMLTELRELLEAARTNPPRLIERSTGVYPTDYYENPLN